MYAINFTIYQPSNVYFKEACTTFKAKDLKNLNFDP